MSSRAETVETLQRLEARAKGVRVPYYDSTTPLELRVMLLAQALGAEDPYQAVLHPDMLDEVLSNTLPEWVLPSGIDPPGA